MFYGIDFAQMIQYIVVDVAVLSIRILWLNIILLILYVFTDFLKRWCVLEHGHLSYFINEEVKVKVLKVDSYVTITRL